MENLSEIQDDLCVITDINLLKFQLIQQREKLFSMINHLIQIELSYENIILHIDYENLFSKYQQITIENNLLKKEYQHLSHACLYLINKTHDLIEERNKYYQEWQQNQILLTPRPDWDKVSNVIDGRMERWKQLATGKSSEQLMNILIQEIINGNTKETLDEQDYFHSLGNDSHILSFLRLPKYHRIINRKMRRRQTGLLIKEIWSDQIQRIKNFPEHLSDYVMKYFEKHCHSKLIAIEMGYNLRDACQRYHHSEQINLFWGILTGQIEEFVYHHQIQCISQLLQHFIRMHKYYSNQISYSQARQAIIDQTNFSLNIFNNSFKNLVLNSEQFIQSLKMFYPRKSSTQIEQLFIAAQHDMQEFNQTIKFDLLFIEDDEGRYGEFLSILIKQIHEDKISYIEQIKQLLLGYPLITVSQFTRVISMIDPKISSEELHRYIQWVFSVKHSSYSTQTIQSMDLEDLLRRLENCACFQH